MTFVSKYSVQIHIKEFINRHLILALYKYKYFVIALSGRQYFLSCSGKER